MKIENKDFFTYDLIKGYTIALSLKNKDYVNDNDMSFNFDENEKNRERFFSKIGIGGLHKVRNKQIHSRIIHRAEKDIVKEGDGLLSTDYGYALYLLTADCYNIFFSTDNGRTFGCLHAGWKGIIEGIVEESLKIFKGETEVVVLQGICEKHFIVEDEVKELFRKRFKESYIRREGEKFSVNLRKIINDILSKESDVKNVDLCNVCRKDILFSYREGDTLKRNISVIWRKT
ncbi:MAG: Multi-copper polyphenol oxidoreductase, laccase [candidate division TA06 bacterium 32_111]|uniref:Multi-copper polyphenol oxidoreductase, laccase n=2 Tax=Bacteria candidate phyla TaxID=1783234 RepID=A0A101I0E0_UNCT6|nr:MAG: Multi-copper polyphenol oxidoreductase, laccase [candidate division TA06 bacterium 32_111]KUK86721.1 MAG: Multi-copper polyphenol oxidoreductase, laccase [candidate division TA06 bacterium 34_109]HAF08343.1 hypothetical protein [candidate division WOR-3 bacterium]HCP16429.1 hypothetical protein [candidate division WOR-3 bacterium]